MRLSGAGARTATLELTAVADRTAEGGAETFRIELGPDGAGANGFDRASLGTNVGGGADPHPTTRTFDVTVNDTVLPTLSIDDTSAPEGEPLMFTIRLSAPSHETVRVTAESRESDPVSAEDYDDFYAGQRYRVTFEPGETELRRGFFPFEDEEDETDETFEVFLSQASGATVADGVAVGTIKNVAPVWPTVSVSAGGDVTEGGDVEFTLTASPAPDTPLDVSVTIAAEGDFGVTAGPDTVTIPASGSATFTRSTAKDNTDEPDGSVTLTLNGGSRYTVAAPPRNAATVAVRDDDEAPKPVLPTVSVSADAGSVTEGGAAAFTVTASPAPATALAVQVTIAAEGDYGVTAGSATVTVPTSGTVTFTRSTTGDQTDEPNGSVTLTLNGGRGYTVAGAPDNAARVAVRDDDEPQPVVSVSAGEAVTEGGDVEFTLRASPAPGAPLAVQVTISAEGDFGVTAGSRPVTIPTGGTATLTLATTPDTAHEPDGSVSLTLNGGSGYTVAGAPNNVATVAVRDDDRAPTVSVSAGGDITEGGDAVFTLTASPAPASALKVQVTVSTKGGYGVTGGGRTVTVPISGSKTLTLPTTNDGTDEDDGSVSVTLKAGSGYTVAGAPNNAATVAVSDDDEAVVPEISVDDASAREGGSVVFRIWLSEPTRARVRVTLVTRESDPVSAKHREDFYAGQDYRVTFEPGEIEQWRGFPVFEDDHDDPGETFEVFLSHPSGATIADGVAVGTIENDDPIPGAWLGRFGRTVAQQALDGIAQRIADPRVPGSRRQVAGQSLSQWFAAPADCESGGEINDTPDAASEPASGRPDRSEGLCDAGPGAGPHGAAAPLSAGWGTAGPGMGGAGLGGFGTGGIGTGGIGTGGPATGGIGAAGFGSVAAPGQGGYGVGGPAGGPAVGGPATGGPGPAGGAPGQTPNEEASSRLLGMLLASDFLTTREEDASGGSLAFWGRAAQTTFGGSAEDLSLTGDVTTAMLGTDYARGNWLAGLALTRSWADGGYDSANTHGGGVESTLTAAIPYGSMRFGERLSVWGAAGYGIGDMRVLPGARPASGADAGNGDARVAPVADAPAAPAIETGIDWRMASVGLRGELPALFGGRGPALAVVSDALWARTASDDTQGLAASANAVTRLRLALESSFSMELGRAGQFAPKLEIGARHDGGDAETGFGLEIGGGLAWSHPTLGLGLDVQARTLVSHQAGDMESRGFSAVASFDPRPGSELGPSFTLRQDLGGPASGGVQALLSPEAFVTPMGGNADAGRWTSEAAWGFKVFRGRFVGSPKVSYGTSPGSRDIGVGWRLEPDPEAGAPELSLGIEALRRESIGKPPDHAVRLEVRARF